MNYVAFLFDVSPGPACTIPEDKKIFRVPAEDLSLVPDALKATLFENAVPAAEGPVEGLQLPVPHMYSA